MLWFGDFIFFRVGYLRERDWCCGTVGIGYAVMNCLDFLDGFVSLRGHTFFFDSVKKDKSYRDQLIEVAEGYGRTKKLDKDRAFKLGKLCKKFGVDDVAIACFKSASKSFVRDDLDEEIKRYLQP